MWRLGKQFKFEASHILPHHEGKCGRLHGHSWIGIAYVDGHRLQESGSSQGMVMDYADINKVLKPLVDQYLDHHHLNDSLGLESPTSESVARWIFSRLRESGLPVTGVEIHETCTSRCIYTELPDFSDAIAMG